MQIENIEVYGFRRALHGMRNPMNSWSKSDTTYTDIHHVNNALMLDGVQIGPKDMRLACSLIKAGPEHRKFLRQIIIWADMSLPRYIWTELDTYKVATVRNSCSTMHKLGHRDLTQDDFQYPIPDTTLIYLNKLGTEFRNAGLLRDHEKQNIIRAEYKNNLPEGFLQMATYMMSYETAFSMYFQRKNHRLREWTDEDTGITSMISNLPYMKDFIEATNGTTSQN